MPMSRASRVFVQTIFCPLNRNKCKAIPELVGHRHWVLKRLRYQVTSMSRIGKMANKKRLSQEFSQLRCAEFTCREAYVTLQ